MFHCTAQFLPVSAKKQKKASSELKNLSDSVHQSFLNSDISANTSFLQRSLSESNISRHLIHQV